MKLIRNVACFVFLFPHLYADVEHRGELYLKEEFDMSEYWYDGMTWNDYKYLRKDSRHPGLIKYVDKIEQQKIAKEVGVEVPKTYIATREKEPIIDIISDLPTYTIFRFFGYIQLAISNFVTWYESILLS